MTVIGMIAI